VTTDRVLPQVSLVPEAERPSSLALVPVAQRAVIAPASSSALVPVAQRAAIAPAARLAKSRGIAFHSTATRAGMLVGMSAAVYAVSLASVAGLEAKSQARAAADVQPALSALASSTAVNDQMTSVIKDASARLAQLTSDYDATSTDMSAYQAQFEQLSSLVAKIQGSAAAMNANFKLPKVTMRGSVGSGGGGSSVVTTTGGSGKP